MVNKDELRKKVETALKAACKDDPNAEILLESGSSGRVAGEVVSIIFAPLSPSERQDRIWAELDKKLAPYERTQVSFIVTVTPKERDILSA